MNRSDLSERHMATDPVCGMMVDPHAGKPTYEYKGETHYFCSEGCRIKFAREPERFLDKKGEPEPLPKGTLYTCPMHPQIVQEGPGHCPICGMALEPMDLPPEHDHGGHPELVDFTRRLKVAVPLSPCARRARYGAACFRHRSSSLPVIPSPAVVEVRPRDSGGALVRLALLRARLCLDQIGLAQYVHADRARHGSGLPLQRGRHRGSGSLPSRHEG